MNFLQSFNIGQRIYVLVALLLVAITTIGGVGVYKMNVIGYEMEEVANRDIPLTKILEKITVHQLEQAILMERALRVQGITAVAEGDDFSSLVKHFKKLAHKTDDEIVQAEEMVAIMIEGAHSQHALEEFQHVLEELKKIEKEHKQYESHVFQMFDGLKVGDVSSASAENVIKVEHEQEELDHYIEGLLEEVSDFTQASMNKALADEVRGKNLILSLSIIILLLGAALAYMLSRSVTIPLGKLTDAMNDLADQKLDTPIPASQYQDEVAQMAKAMRVFQENMKRARDLEEEQVAIKKKQQQRQNELNQLIGIFGSTIGAVFEKMLSSSNDMVGQAQNMLNQSQGSQDMAGSVATEAEESAANAGSLSAATEEMVASIREISQQVTKSSQVTKQAVEYSQNSEQDVVRLQQISQEIGEVVSLITDIAEQTNLLALNATIEAARAGEAGKGFAVVANEVKSLAAQTGKATEEISGKIRAIQTASGQSAQSIGKIGTIISDIDQYITAIVAAIEEQNSTTQEIARSVEFVSQSSSRVSESIQNIQTQSSEVGQSSQMVNESANSMAKDSEVLGQEVKIFLGAMQNTDIDDNSYEARKVSCEASITTTKGTNWSGHAHEISCAHVVVSPALNEVAGESLKLNISGIDKTMNARIAKHEEGRTIIQLPLDLGHIEEMKGHIAKIA